MDDDAAQVALETACRHLGHVCRDDVLTQLRKNRHAANQRAMVARRKCEQLALEAAFLRYMNSLFMKQVRKLEARLETVTHLMEHVESNLGDLVDAMGE